ncbi:MAG: nicotinate phosphoribosyltransferase [Cyclonatronaceae bacterium]
MFQDRTARSGLYTDFYELTMAQGYVLRGLENQPASFDYFFRRAPLGGQYAVFAGLHSFIEAIRELQFGPAALEYLREQGFREPFLNWLAGFTPEIRIEAAKEGSIIFPNEPVLQLSGPIAHCLMLETLCLNTLNFQSLIATKAFRMANELAGEQFIIDFGLRRGHGLAGLHASRAACIGGVQSSSNVLSGMEHGHGVSGTHAHAWIQSFDTELEAFRAYAETYPESCILLVDTYDTLGSGLPNAITVGKEMQKRGQQLAGIRLDSGEFSRLIPAARKMLDEAGLGQVKIAVSDGIDEYAIRKLNAQPVRPDVFGVGTRLITSHGDSALNGVYKMSEIAGRPILKRSDDPAKTTLPGRKKLYRIQEQNVQGEPCFKGDVITRETEPVPEAMLGEGAEAVDFRPVIWESARQPAPETPAIAELRERVRQEKSKLDARLFRWQLKGAEQDLSAAWKVQLAPELRKLRDTLHQKAAKNT